MIIDYETLGAKQVIDNQESKQSCMCGDAENYRAHLNIFI